MTKTNTMNKKKKKYTVEHEDKISFLFQIIKTENNSFKTKRK